MILWELLTNEEPWQDKAAMQVLTFLLNLLADLLLFVSPFAMSSVVSAIVLSVMVRGPVPLHS